MYGLYVGFIIFMSKQKTKKSSKLYQPDWHEFFLYLGSPRRVFFINLLAGIGRGFGFVMGATVVVALVVFIISKILSEIPIIGEFFHWLDQFLQESLKNKQE